MDSILRWSTFLESLGVKPGDPVAVMLSPSADAYLAWLGIAWLGALEIPLSTAYRGTMLEQVLTRTRARVLITTSEQFAKIEALGPRIEHLRVAITVDGQAHGLPGLTIVDAASGVAAAQPVPRRTPAEWDTASVLYTAGTTGPSKGVRTPWGVFNHAGGSIMMDGRTFEDGACYQTWPINHLSGKATFAKCVAADLRVTIRDTFSVRNFWPEVNQYRCTHAVLMGVAGALWQQPPTESDADTPLAHVLMNPLPVEYREFAKRFGVTVSTVWGMTEVGVVLATSNPANERTCGTPIGGYTVRLVDEHDQEVPVGTVGQMIVRHERPWAMNDGYLDAPEATAEAWRHGWFHTRDAFVQHDDGDFYFVDRMKDCIRRRGENISSLELEAEIRAHPDVADCACVAETVMSGLSGTTDHEVRIFVVRVPDSEISAETLVRDLSERLPSFMVPRFVDFVDSLPKNAMGRVQKAELRERPVTSKTWDRVGVDDPRRDVPV